jgi:hypothetical protein
MAISKAEMERQRRSEAARILGSFGGKMGGKSKSKRKTEFSRVNGKKGGRPVIHGRFSKRSKPASKAA